MSINNSLVIANARCWTYGDGINTDFFSPSRYLNLPNEEAVKYCLVDLDPNFAAEVQSGDAFIAGEDLGIGSSRESAPMFLRLLGIKAVIAKSFGRIFYRNCLNLGVPALVCPDAGRIGRHDRVTIRPVEGEVVLEASGERLACEPIPPHLVGMISDGGLIPHLKKRFASNG